MIIKEITVAEAIEGAFGSFADAVQPMWGYISYTEEPVAGAYSMEDLLEILLEGEEGELI